MSYYDNQTYYDILDVKPDATIDKIQEAKYKLKFEERVPFSTWAKIDEAYAVLSDPQKRKEYDDKLREETNNINLNEQSFDEDSLYLNEPSNLQQGEIVPKLRRVGKEIVLAIPTAIIGTINIIKKLHKKHILSKQQLGEKITEVKTEETSLVEVYRKNLDENIDNVLQQYHYNYNLTIDKVRYENYIELLKKMIEQKENEVVKKHGLLKYKLQLTALRNQLKAFESSLERVNAMLLEVQRPQRLTKIYEDIAEINEKIEQINESPNRRVIALKKLEVRKENLINKSKLKIQRIKNRREYYAIFKDSFLSAHSLSENFVDNLFVPIDKVDEKVR